MKAPALSTAALVKKIKYLNKFFIHGIELFDEENAPIQWPLVSADGYVRRGGGGCGVK